MMTKTFQCSNISEIEQMLPKYISDDFKPTLAIIFTSIQHDLEAIRISFKKRGIDLVGGTTAGEIVDNTLYEASIAVMLMDMDKTFYKIYPSQHDKNAAHNGAFEAGQIVRNSFANPAVLIMSSGLGIDVQGVLWSIKDGVGKEISLYGAMAGDDLQMQRTFVFTHETILDNGFVLLILDTDKLLVQGLAISGWEPLGGINTITKATDNIVYAINGEPAYDVFMRYFGLSTAPKSIKDDIITLQISYPLQVIRENGQTILRSLFFLNKEEGSLVLAGGVKEGDRFQFSNSPGFEVIEQTIEEFGTLKKSMPHADAIVLFSSKGRHSAFGPMLEDEIEGLYQYWKTPLIGFLSYGEIGNTQNGTCEFHNETCSLVLLKEK